MGANNLRTEIFASIEGFENYAVSNFGRVINAKRGRDLRPGRDAGGYLKVALYRNGVRYDFGVHRLVAKAFFVDFNQDLEVYHVDGNKEDCSITNLSLGNFIRVRVRIRETNREFDSMMACAEFLGTDTAMIYRCMVGKRSFKDFTFEPVDGRVKR